MQCFSKAIDYAPTDKKEDIKSEAAKEASNLFISLVLTSCENFSKIQTEDRANDIIECAVKVKEYALQLLNKCDVTPDEYEQEIATCINNIAINTFKNVIVPEYEGKNERYLSEYAFNDFIKKASYCSSLIKAAIDFSNSDNLNNADRYKNLEYIKSTIAKEASNLFISAVSTSCENFNNMQTDDYANNIIECAANVKEYARQLLNKYDITLHEYEQEIAACIYNTAVNTFSDVIIPEYENDNEGHPSEYAFNDLIEKAGYCSSLIKAAIDFSDNDDLNNSDRYKKLIEINNYCINSCSWSKEFGYENAAQGALGGIALLTVGISGQHWYWKKQYTLTASAIEYRKKENEEFQKLSDQCRERGLRKSKENEQKLEEEKAKAIKTYWAEHSEEKQQFESELDKLLSEINELESQLIPFNKEINDLKDNRERVVPSEKEKNVVLSEISRLRKEQSQLGVFKGKEKKAIQSQINELNARLLTINEAIELEKEKQLQDCDAKIREAEEKAKPIKDKVTATQKRIEEINTELTKER